MLDTLFDPLSQKYCDYFYFLQVLAFVITMLMVSIVVKSLFTKKPLSLETSVNIITGPLLTYFVNRLYYTMCVNSFR
jgi:hypothetical protein